MSGSSHEGDVRDLRDNETTSFWITFLFCLCICKCCILVAFNTLQLCVHSLTPHSSVDTHAEFSFYRINYYKLLVFYRRFSRNSFTIHRLTYGEQFLPVHMKACK